MDPPVRTPHYFHQKIQNKNLNHHSRSYPNQECQNFVHNNNKNNNNISNHNIPFNQIRMPQNHSRSDFISGKLEYFKK